MVSIRLTCGEQGGLGQTEIILQFGLLSVDDLLLHIRQTHVHLASVAAELKLSIH